ncbi:tyrosine-protein phosphatase [Streptomonospora alba]|uniref:tyrosine-protein phosphatase n=1 Tax=Streptomonospora alba TaxID=183763 RepID=UPI000A073C9B|nr:tyrosine-protein phosphatase [Streptomonospora alba]
MHNRRRLGWDCFHNARDLGGLPARDGRTTRYGALYRSAAPLSATAKDWEQARAAGVGTVVDLRNDDEIRRADGAPPPDIARVAVPLDDITDIAFRDRVAGAGMGRAGPLYYRLFLEHKADRCAAVITALARARPSGVLFHCAVGRDRTGIVAMLLLSLAGVEPGAIADDYERTTEDARPLFAAMGREDEALAIEAGLAARGMTLRAAFLDALADLDAHAYLRDAGVPAADIEALRSRLLA